MTTPYVDWSKIPERFKWVATDVSGSIYAFAAQPSPEAGFWHAPGAADIMYVNSEAILRLTPAWEYSRIKRPAAESVPDESTNKRRYHPAFFDAYADTPFGDWPRPAQVALFEAWLDGARVECPHVDGSGWGHIKQPNWNAVTRYRIAPMPVTKPSIDWSCVAPEFKFLARDKHGSAYIYVIRPKLGDAIWLNKGTCGHATAFASYQPGDCDWKDSLVERPAD